MSEVHAAMGMAVLPHIEDQIALRKTVIQQYDELLLLLVERPHEPPGTIYNQAYYPILLKDSAQRVRVTEQLIANGITPRRYFYPSLNLLPYVKPSKCKHSEMAADRVLSLPLYAELAMNDVQRIARLISSAL